MVTISNITTYELKPTSVLIFWDTTSVGGGDSAIEYGTTPSYGSTTPPETIAYFHKTRLSNLSPGTLYHYRVHSKDYYGVETLSSDKTFTTTTQAQLESTIKAARRDGGLPKTYYISTSGSDSYNGLTTSTALRNISAVVSKTDVGDTILVMDGTYSLPSVVEFAEAQVGIDVAHITIKPYSGTPKFINTSASGIIITSYTDLSGFYFEGNGFAVHGSWCTISNCEVNLKAIENTVIAKFSNSHNTVENCKIYDSSMNAIQLGNPGVRTTPPGKYITIRNNMVGDNPIHAGVDISGIYQYVAVTGNTFYGTKAGYDVTAIVYDHNDPTTEGHREYITISDNIALNFETIVGIRGSNDTNYIISNNDFEHWRDANNAKPLSIDMYTSGITGPNNFVVRENTFIDLGKAHFSGGQNILFEKNYTGVDAGLELSSSSGVIRNPLDYFECSLTSSSSVVIEYIDNSIFTLITSGSALVSESAISYSTTKSSYSATSASSGYTTIAGRYYSMTVRPTTGTASVAAITTFDTTKTTGVAVDVTVNGGNNTIDYSVGSLVAYSTYAVKINGTSISNPSTGSNGTIRFSASTPNNGRITVERTGGGGCPDPIVVMNVTKI